MAWFPEPCWTIADKLFPPVCATIAKLFVPTWVTQETLAFGGNVFGAAAANAFTLMGAAIFAAEPGAVGHLKLPASLPGSADLRNKDLARQAGRGGCGQKGREDDDVFAHSTHLWNASC